MCGRGPSGASQRPRTRRSGQQAARTGSVAPAPPRLGSPPWCSASEPATPRSRCSSTQRGKSCGDTASAISSSWRRLIAERPEVDALAAGLRVTREKLDAVLGGTDADLGTKLLGISPQDWSQDIAEHAVGLRSIPGHPGPHRGERGRKAVCVSPASLERTRQGGARRGEALRRRVVGGGEPAVTRPGDAGEPGTRAPAPDPEGMPSSRRGPGASSRSAATG
jgi:hypothetical protein